MNKFSPMLTQICRFGIVGLTAAAIHFTTVVTVVQLTGLKPLIANIAGFLVSFQMSYWGHRQWTFNGTAALHRVAFPRLLCIQLINFAANESLFYLFLSLHLPYPVALLIVLAVLPVFTFVTSKWWVFG